VADPAVYEQQKALLDKVPSGYMFYPIVFINGDPKITGGANPYQVMYAVQTLLQAAETSKTQGAS
jgi:disulfide oxidoreductase YuzD